MKHLVAAIVVAGVALAAGSAGAQSFEVDLGTGTIAPAADFSVPATCDPRTSVPRGIDFTSDSIVVKTRRRAVRQRIRVDGDGLMWVAEAGGAVVVAAQLHKRTPFGSDVVFAVDRKTGKLLWRSELVSIGGGNLSGGERIVISTWTELLVLDARTGREVARIAATPGLQHVCRGVGGVDLIKTSRSLVALEADTAALRWQAAASWDAAPVVVGADVVDVWIDRPGARWGLVTHRLTDGGGAITIDLGPAGPWDLVRFALDPRGGDKIAVDAMFAWE